MDFLCLPLLEKDFLSKAMADYELLDDFHYNLTNEDFSGKYAAFFFLNYNFDFADQSTIKYTN